MLIHRANPETSSVPGVTVPGVTQFWGQSHNSGVKPAILRFASSWGQACDFAIRSCRAIIIHAMARKPRIEIEGGLYHVLARGNNRQKIFASEDDYLKMLSLLERQKSKVPFYLYAFCLMPNHLHLLIERQADSIGRIMHRLLTGYSQYYNRRYNRVGHLFQGRHKSILCQSDAYLSELVRYIHLNPVRAGLVPTAEEYPYSSHRVYLGLEESSWVDTEPVLRHFGASKKRAIATYRQFVNAGLRQGHREEYYHIEGGRMLGSEEFCGDIKHRIGEVESRREKEDQEPLDSQALVKAVERSTGMRQKEFCTSGKSKKVVLIKEAMIVVGRERGIRNVELAMLTGVNSSNVSRRYESAQSRLGTSPELQSLLKRIRAELNRFK